MLARACVMYLTWLLKLGRRLRPAEGERVPELGRALILKSIALFLPERGDLLSRFTWLSAIKKGLAQYLDRNEQFINWARWSTNIFQSENHTHSQTRWQSIIARFWTKIIRKPCSLLPIFLTVRQFCQSTAHRFKICWVIWILPVNQLYCSILHNRITVVLRSRSVR